MDSVVGKDALANPPQDTGIPEGFRERFRSKMNLVALRIPKSSCQKWLKSLKGYILDKPRMRSIAVDPDDEAENRLLLLKESVTAIGDLPADMRDAVAADGLQAVPHEVEFDYSYWPAEHVLKELLPPEITEYPTSFETIGHIAHLNLRRDLLPYRSLIGQVLLDKNAPRIRTIVNKTGDVGSGSVYRVFPMEVIAGEEDFETEVRQHSTLFRMRFDEVYWNSRLECEHKRMVDSFAPGDIVCDAFAGIGPFAVPAAQRGHLVYSNDLNPASTKYLRVNTKLNKVVHRVRSYNMCAREFVREILTPPPPGEEAAAPEAAGEGAGAEGGAGSGAQAAGGGAAGGGAAGGEAGAGAEAGEEAAGEGAEEGGEKSKKKKKRKGGVARSGLPPQVEPALPASGAVFDHVLMNLPASAETFLGMFAGLFGGAQWEGRALPMVHCYCFTRAPEAEAEADVLRRAEGYLGHPIEGASVHCVRDVAPNKTMMCLSFRLPDAVGRGPPSPAPPNVKKARVGAA